MPLYIHVHVTGIYQRNAMIMVTILYALNKPPGFHKCTSLFFFKQFVGRGIHRVIVVEFSIILKPFRK